MTHTMRTSCPRRDNMRCNDCRADTIPEYYMVHDHLWHAVAMGRGLLCVGCLEQRLGRRLHRGDFTSAPVNDLRDPRFRHRSARLLDRLTSPRPEDGIQLALWAEP